MANGEKLVKFLMETKNQPGHESFYFGKVLSVSPLSISVDSKLTLDKDFLIVGQLCKRTTSPTGSLLWDGMKTGDTVLLIRSGNGQKWYVAERV